MSAPPDSEAGLDVGRTLCSQSDPLSSSQNTAQSNTELVPNDHSRSNDSESESTESESTESEDSIWDPDGKPSLPYKLGFEFTAFSREPPSPADIYDAIWVRSKNRHELTQSQIKYCLAESVEDAQSGSQTKEGPCGISKKLHITSLIQVGSSCGAQVVGVDNDMVAKIFDPLYYEEYEEGWWKQDVVKRARDDYVREAAAYDKLRASKTAAKITPKFYGAWSTTITTPIDNGDTKDRTVRLILIQQLHGQCMRSINPRKLRKRVRSKALMKVLDAEAVLYEAGITHWNFRPQNIMINIPSGDDPDIKVHIVDFAQSKIVELKGDRLSKLRNKYLGRICSPCVRFYRDMTMFSAYGWCSSKDMGAEKWLWRHYKTDERYFVVNWDPEHPSKAPEYNLVEL